MKHITFYIAAVLTTLVSCNSGKVDPVANEEDKVSLFIDSIVNTMSIEEKVGQMTNLTITSLMIDSNGLDSLDMAKVEDVIVKHHVGSIQNVKSHAYPISKWHYLINTIQEYTLEKTKHKIPSLYCIDAVHGTNYTIDATLFPHNLGLAATRNSDLVKEGAHITAMETRASGIRYNFSPVLDCGRQPYWPRLIETFGEDIHLTTEMGNASVLGYQSDDPSSIEGVAACMKHFVGYSYPQSGKDRAPAYIPEIMLREYFLPSFEKAVQSNALTCMVNSGEVNGVPLHASKYLLTDVLRGELGFEGVIITDWEDVQKLNYRHRVAENNKEAVYKSVNAGIDLCIVPYDYTFSDNLIELVREGRISEERLNESVRRILMLKYKVGLFDEPYVEQEALKNFAKPEYRESALQAARESITLLKNQKDILPLDPTTSESILIVGPAAESITTLNGCWSFTWQGRDPQFADSAQYTISQAINDKFSGARIQTLKGCDFEGDALINPNRIKNAAKSADVIIVCLGEDAYAETLGDINDLELPQIQLDLVNLLSESGKPIVLILTEGRPRIIRRIEPKVSSVLLAYWPGSRGARAIADIIAGDYNPDARLPITYPKYSGDIKTYDYKFSEASGDPNNDYYYSYEPQWSFGFGLSYSNFEYSEIRLSADTIRAGDTLDVSIEVTNTSERDGKHSVELYTRDLYASITPSMRRLRAFKKLLIPAGETKKVKFQLTKQDLSFINESLKRTSESGQFEVIIGNQKKGFYLK